MDKLSKEEIEREDTGTNETGAEEAPGIPVKRKRGRPRLLNGEVTVKDVIDAINSTGGRIYESCAVCSMSVSEFYKRFRYNKKVEDALVKARQMGFELVTDTLLDKAMKGDMRAIQTYLRFNPIAKMNDWTDHQTLTIKEEKPLTDEEKQNLANKLFG